MVVAQGAQVNTFISREDPLWALDEPGDIRRTDCLRLKVHISDIIGAPADQAYSSLPCSHDGLAASLCEVPWLFNFNDLIVNPEEQANLDCGFIGTYSHCVWEKDNNIFK
ncbi:unnamed protein product, partial [Meganyctiphanes norvegica]